jgi:surface carbohydrate biosynthesis protein
MKLSNDKSDMKTVVFLVDNKRRDLPGLSLVAHHLRAKGIQVYLEPLEAWKACLLSRKPDMIVFNHLLGSHLEEFSRELHSRGVLVGVLLNEGILYSKDELDFNASKFHNNAHIDHFFCWYQDHADALKENLGGGVNFHVIGVPRFDFYFPPFNKQGESKKNKKTILVPTNFVFIALGERGQAFLEKHFEPWKDRIPHMKDYNNLVAVNKRGREKLFKFLNCLLKDTQHHIVLRPHPNETVDVYERWYSELSDNAKEKITLDRDSQISDLIMQCDLKVSCETCTTTMEAWIAKKPTILLLFDQHPVFWYPWEEDMALTVSDPESLNTAVNSVLEGGESPVYQEKRKEHLAKYCNSPDGQVCVRFATLLTGILSQTAKPNFSTLAPSYYRKALKLKLLHALGLPYNYRVTLNLKALVAPKKYKPKQVVYEKTIKPKDIGFWAEKIKEYLSEL